MNCWFSDPFDFVIKRVVCLEGDEVVNAPCRPGFTFLLDQGTCWVEGDNRSNSVDSSSHYGPVFTGLVLGKATHIIWPPRRWQRLRPQVPDVPGRTVESIPGSPNDNVRLINHWM